MKTTKLLALTAALNLAIIGAGYAYSQATSEHEIATVTQVTSSSPFDVLKLSEVEKEYPDEMEKLEAVAEIKTQLYSLEKAKAEAEAAKIKAEQEHAEFLNKGEYECTEYTAIHKPDGSSTDWDKGLWITNLKWDYKTPANMEMTSKRVSFKFVNMQGYETSYGVASENTSDGAEYEIKLDRLGENVISVMKLESSSEGTYNTLWICR